MVARQTHHMDGKSTQTHELARKKWKPKNSKKTYQHSVFFLLGKKLDFSWLKRPVAETGLLGHERAEGVP